MSSVIEVIVDGDPIYEVTIDQPDSLYEVSISDTSPTYEVINFDAGMLSLALIDDSTTDAFKAYSSYKVSQLLTGYATTSHNHDLVYQPLGTYLTPSAIGTSVQAYDADLTSWAGIAPSSKQDTLTFDLVPTDASTNPVQSNGVFDSLALKSDTTHSHALDGLSDVTVPTPTSGDVLSWNGTAWVNSVPSAGGSSTLTIDNKTTAYTVVAGDLGTIINCTSGTFTVSLTAAATLGAGFNCWIWNTGNDIITIDGNLSETIDGTTTKILRRGEGLQIVCDGTNFNTVANKAHRAFSLNMSGATTATASGSGAMAIGNATASGSGAFASGWATASGNYSIAFGGSNNQTTASSAYAVAIGNNSGGNSSQAVTGAGAMALGGSYASGTDSFAAAIVNNTSSYGATGANSVAMGLTNKATGGKARSFGASLGIASGASSIEIGSESCTASGTRSIALGSFGNAVEYGKLAQGYAANSLAIAQYGRIIFYRATTDNTPTVLASSNSTAGTSNQLILPNDSAFTFTGTVISKQSGSTNVASWKIEGVIVRGTTAGSTVLVASTVTAISNVPAWTLALSADTTNGGLAVTFTGATATNIRTVCTIESTEVIYA